MSVYSGWARQPDGRRRALLGPEAETMRRWLAFLRIAVGALYLYAFVSSVTGDFLATFSSRLKVYADANSLLIISRLLSNYVVPHAQFLGWVVLASELILGALLLVGLGTRVVAVVAILMQLLYLLAALGTSTLATVTGGLFIAALLVIFGTDGGWRWSLDEMIMNRR